MRIINMWWEGFCGKMLNNDAAAAASCREISPTDSHERELFCLRLFTFLHLLTHTYIQRNITRLRLVYIGARDDDCLLSVKLNTFKTLALKNMAFIIQPLCRCKASITSLVHWEIEEKKMIDALTLSLYIYQVLNYENTYFFSVKYHHKHP